jgi:hypothetical protein
MGHCLNYVSQKENHGIQKIGIEVCQGNIIVHQRRVLQIWENHITELYDRANRPEHLEIEPEAEVDEDEKGPYILHSEVEKAIVGRRWSQTRVARSYVFPVSFTFFLVDFTVYVLNLPVSRFLFYM